MRPLCSQCHSRPCEVNYHRDGVIHYRSVCGPCHRKAKPSKPRWEQAGYKKKTKCEKCGFVAKYPEQIRVFHVDGNLTNCRPQNLKSICLNCQMELHQEGITWKQGGLTPDL